MSGHTYQLAIYQRLEAIFIAFKEGKDVSPAMRYRLEGFIEAAIELGDVFPEDISEIKLRACRAVNGNEAMLEPTESLLPAMMQRAPVKPSTKG